MSGNTSNGDDDAPRRRPLQPLKPGGGGGAGDGGGGGGGIDPCDIVQDAPLNSPQQSVVSGLTVGDVLVVALTGVAPNEQLIVQTASGQIAGSLTHRGHIAVIDCINAGVSYEAVVSAKTGGFVQVRVQRS